MAQRAAFVFGLSTAFVFAVLAQQRWQTVPATTAQIDILNVGQGDAIHIRSLTGSDVLIDGGPDNTVIERLGEVLPFWDRTIEVMVSSHPDADHITGLLTVFDYYQVKQLVVVDLPITKAAQTELLQRAARQGTEIVHAMAGDTITLSSVETISVVYPLPDTPVADLPTNDASYVMLYTFAGADAANTTTLLTSGDASDLVENQLVQAGAIPDVDILKVGHHGSASSSSAQYVAATQAEYAVVSVGADNDYGHPTAEALKRLRSTSQILRTDQLGTISFVINQDGYRYVEQ